MNSSPLQAPEETIALDNTLVSAWPKWSEHPAKPGTDPLHVRIAVCRSQLLHLWYFVTKCKNLLEIRRPKLVSPGRLLASWLKGQISIMRVEGWAKAGMEKSLSEQARYLSARSLQTSASQLQFRYAYAVLPIHSNQRSWKPIVCQLLLRFWEEEA